jgi:rubrerythrin
MSNNLTKPKKFQIENKKISDDEILNEMIAHHNAQQILQEGFLDAIVNSITALLNGEGFEGLVKAIGNELPDSLQPLAKATQAAISSIKNASQDFEGSLEKIPDPEVKDAIKKAYEEQKNEYSEFHKQQLQNLITSIKESDPAMTDEAAKAIASAALPAAANSTFAK